MDTTFSTTKISHRNRVRAALLGSILLAGTVAACGSSPEQVGTSKPATEARPSAVAPNAGIGPLMHRSERGGSAVVAVEGASVSKPAVAPNPSQGPLMHRSERTVAAAAAKTATEWTPVVAPNPANGPLQHRLER